MRLHIDLETRSPADLIGCGVYVYAENPHTQVILAGWAIDDGPFRIWRILRGDPIPIELHYALVDPNTTLVAHNSGFERVLLTVAGLRQGFLPRDAWEAIRAPDRWSCTAARAAGCGLPRALEKVAQALNLNHQKDMDGHRLMLEMCAPRGLDLNGNYIWLEDEPRMVRLGEYCVVDGLAEREADHLLPEFSPFEKDVHATTERMNDRGVMVDTKLLESLKALVTDATNYLNAKLQALSCLKNTSEWCGIGSNNRECYSRDGAAALTPEGSCSHCGGWPAETGKTVEIPKVTNPGKIVKWLKSYGIDTEDDKIGKWIIAGLLENEALPGIVREVLVTRRDGGKSSTAKFNTLKKRLNADERIRGALLYAGAAATARWSSRGAQLQNLPRVKTVKRMDAAIAAVIDSTISMQEIERQFGPPMVVASELVRPTFIAAPGHWLARSDYSQIETRVTAWLAGERRLLDAFRAYDAGTGPDLYIVTAADVCGVPISAIDKDDPRRQTGKVTILACMFGGGKRALANMAKLYGIQLSEASADAAVQALRSANSNIKSFWYDLDRAAIECMRGEPGQIHQVRNGIWFKRNNTCLVMHLPSGRHLVYWYPRLELKEMPWLDQNGNPAKKECVTYYAEDSQKHIWRRFTAWHGLWCENAVQATARDIMAHALVLLEKRGMKPILTVHDEAICQLSKQQYPTDKLAGEAVRQILLEIPSWAYGLPIDADGSAADRYVKG